MSGEYVFLRWSFWADRESESNMRRIKATAAENARKLETTLKALGWGQGDKCVHRPAFTVIVQPSGVKVSRIVNLTDDIALNAASGVRIGSHPRKVAIGVEVPNRK